MRDIVDVKARDLNTLQNLKTVGWISYVLHLLVAVAAVLPGAQMSPVLLVIALVIDLVKREDAEGSWLGSHFAWRIRTVFWAGALYLVTAPLWLLLVFPGWMAWGVISIWFLYRVVKGMVAMNAGEPVGVVPGDEA